MDLKLQGKLALITASTAGIGRAIAQSLANEGADIVINGRTQARVDAALRAIGSGRGVVADLATRAGRSKLIKEVPAVDILVNNLGVYAAKNLADIMDDDWEQMFQVNVVSGAALSQYYLSGMLARNWGRVVFIASETGVNVPPDMIPYGVSKAAQIALARGLAETTAGTGVTVNSVLPGPTRSEGIERFLAELKFDGVADREHAEREIIKKLRPSSLLQRFAEPEEVAQLVSYLASAGASATNGAAVRVEGGLLRGVL